MQRYTLAISVQVPESASLIDGTNVKEIVQRVINVGLADASTTVHEYGADADDETRAVSLIKITVV